MPRRLMINGRETEAEKRKQADDDDVGSGSKRQKQKKARDADYVNVGETAVKEEEVEEFVAIISRIHEAVRYFKNADGGGCKLTDRGSRLRAMLESNEEASGVKVGPKKDERVEENVSLDLNADPDPE